jgi:hypothetical protein
MRCIDKTQERNGKVYGGYLQNQDLIGQMESEHMPGDRQISTQSRSHGRPLPEGGLTRIRIGNRDKWSHRRNSLNKRRLWRIVHEP